MACHIIITGHVDLAAAKEIGRLAADIDAKHTRSHGPGIYIVSDDTDDLFDLEQFCVANRIWFRRMTYRPSQMGQEPHYVVFEFPMAEPQTKLLPAPQFAAAS